MKLYTDEQLAEIEYWLLRIENIYSKKQPETIEAIGKIKYVLLMGENIKLEMKKVEF